MTVGNMHRTGPPIGQRAIVLAASRSAKGRPLRRGVRRNNVLAASRPAKGRPLRRGVRRNNALRATSSLAGRLSDSLVAEASATLRRAVADATLAVLAVADAALEAAGVGADAVVDGGPTSG